ncbi:MAG TPA: hypothetical protein VIJ33_05725, partial [Solirubrobacteraceae bacterium]
MSVSTEVQRTLVKSPPELWSELSNPDALARHLAEFGEIRITSVEPETRVAWEAEDATGVVHLKQSGWGTKVTLSVTRVPPISGEAPEEAKPDPRLTAVVEPVAEGEPEPAVEVEQTPEPIALEPACPQTGEPVAEGPEPEPEPVAEQPMPREGFFARLFRRRKPKPVKLVEPELPPGFEPLAVPELIYEPTPVPTV